MVLNTEKTVCMCLTNKKKNVLEFPYSLDGKILRRVTEYKYLGVVLTSNLNWNAHVKYVSSKALVKLFFSKKNVRTL